MQRKKAGRPGCRSKSLKGAAQALRRIVSLGSRAARRAQRNPTPQLTEEKRRIIANRFAELRKLRRRLRKTDTGNLRRALDDFDRILAHPDIDRVKVERSYVTVYTRAISLDWRGEKHLLGKFRISLHVERLPYRFSDGAVRVENLDYRPYHNDRHWNHPHVMNCQPCLGNTRRSLRMLMERRQFPEAFALMIEYLKTWDFADRGTYPPTKWR